MPKTLPEEPKWKARSCGAVALIVVLFVALLIAISSGWLATTMGGKSTRIPAVSDNQS